MPPIMGYIKKCRKHGEHFRDDQMIEYEFTKGLVFKLSDQAIQQVIEALPKMYNYSITSYIDKLPSEWSRGEYYKT